MHRAPAIPTSNAAERGGPRSATPRSAEGWAAVRRPEDSSVPYFLHFALLSATSCAIVSTPAAFV